MGNSAYWYAELKKWDSVIVWLALFMVELTCLVLLVPVWGEIQDAASFAVIDKIWTLPTHEVGDLIMLNKELNFDLVLK